MAAQTLAWGAHGQEMARWIDSGWGQARNPDTEQRCRQRTDGEHEQPRTRPSDTHTHPAADGHKALTWGQYKDSMCAHTHARTRTHTHTSTCTHARARTHTPPHTHAHTHKDKAAKLHGLLYQPNNYIHTMNTNEIHNLAETVICAGYSWEQCGRVKIWPWGHSVMTI